MDEDVAGAISELRCALTCLKCMEKSMECSANVITNTGKTPIAVESAVFILFSSTM